MKKLGRSRKSLLNIAVSTAAQLVAALAGMFLPRALILAYGSPTNGLITSLTQIAGYLSLLEGGLLASAAAALYKPLAENDVMRVNEVLSSAKYYYRRVGALFLAVLVCAAAVYPLIASDTGYPYVWVLAVFLLIGVNGATQILFIGKYKALLIASQNNGAVLIINSASTLLYALILIAAAHFKIDILIGLSAAVLSYLLRSAAFYIVTKKLLPQYSYISDKSKTIFPQRTDALIYQIMGMLSLNGGVLVLTVLQTPMAAISVYTTYSLVLSALYMLMYSVENSMTSALGDLISRENQDAVKKKYAVFDTAYHIVLTIVGSCLLYLYLPFITVYTSGAADADYILPVESLLFSIVGIMWMLRNQLTLLPTACGMFRKLKNASILEAVIVIAVGAAAYLLWGLKGLLLAKLFSEIAACACYAAILYRDILKQPVYQKLYNVLITAAGTGLTLLIMKLCFSGLECTNAYQWLLLALLTFAVSAAVTFAVFLPTRKKELIYALNSIISIKNTDKQLYNEEHISGKQQ